MKELVINNFKFELNEYENIRVTITLSEDDKDYRYQVKKEWFNDFKNRKFMCYTKKDGKRGYYAKTKEMKSMVETVINYFDSIIDEEFNKNNLGYSQDELKEFQERLNKVSVYNFEDFNDVRRYIELAHEITKEMATKDNYMLNSVAIFKVIENTPERKPDYESASGSEYWYTENGVIRKSNHWNACVARCSWYINGMDSCNELKVAYCDFKDFAPKGYIAKEINERHLNELKMYEFTYEKRF